MITKCYKSFRITAFALDDPNTGFWIPHAQIISSDAAFSIPIVKGPPAVHTKREDAESFAIKMGEIWIDGYG